MARELLLDVEVRDMTENFDQKRYLVHLYDDVLWTDNPEEVAAAILSELRRWDEIRHD